MLQFFFHNIHIITFFSILYPSVLFYYDCYFNSLGVMNRVSKRNVMTVESKLLENCGVIELFKKKT